MLYVAHNDRSNGQSSSILIKCIAKTGYSTLFQDNTNKAASNNSTRIPYPIPAAAACVTAYQAARRCANALSATHLAIMLKINYILSGSNK